MPNGVTIIGPIYLNVSLVNGVVEVPITTNYKVYTALINQEGTNDPIVTVLENTLGVTIIWTRLIQGVYQGILSSPIMTIGKTFFSTNGSSIGATLACVNYGTLQGDIQIDRVQINHTSISSGSIPLAKVDNLINLPIEIRVYN
jgi:hypothetical protein